MHRSGTSLVASLLEGIGVDFGPPETMLPSGLADNPEGYMEQAPVRELNDALLETMGGSVLDPPTLEPGWQRSDAVTGLRSDANALVVRLFAGRAHWGWKDPRMCLTLPFWLDVIGPMDFVLCVRSPTAVADSLDRRYCRGLGRIRTLTSPVYRRRNWFKLWLRYTNDALRATEGHRRIVVVYEHTHSDGERVVRSLHEFARAPAGTEPDLRRLRSDLWRSRPPATDRSRYPEQELAEAAYRRLSRGGAGDDQRP
jgi:hypothetical protein